MLSFIEFKAIVRAQLPNAYSDQISFTENNFKYNAEFNNLKIYYYNGWYRVTTDDTNQTLSVSPNLVSAIRYSYDLMAETILKPEMFGKLDTFVYQ